MATQEIGYQIGDYISKIVVHTDGIEESFMAEILTIEDGYVMVEDSWTDGVLKLDWKELAKWQHVPH